MVRTRKMIRIRKNEARKLFDNYVPVYLIPCKLNPGPWVGYGVKVEKDSDRQLFDDFDDVVNVFEYYNCNAETGLYVHYYKEETKTSLHN